MRTFTGLHARLLDPDTLDRAARLTVRGKRRRRDVAWFLFRREEELARLHAALVAGTWRPEGFEVVRIRDPKPRIIARASIADRVIHAALVDCMMPALVSSLRPECMACRPGLGTHRAALRLLEHVRRHRFFLHLDVKSYFPTVDLQILRGLLARRIRDRPFLGILDRVLDAGDGLYRSLWIRAWLKLPPHVPGKGLPVGAYTSQVLASWLYLDGLDHFVKRELKVPGYVRYVDDLLLLADDAAQLADARQRIGTWLFNERGLRLKWPDASVRSCRETLVCLGHAITREGLRPLPRAKRKLRAVASNWVWTGQPDRQEMARSLAARMGNLLP